MGSWPWPALAKSAKLLPMATDQVPAPTGPLLVAAAKMHRTAVARVLASASLHVGQDLLLRELAAEDGMSQRELADRLGVEQATVGVALRRLEAGGFVARRPAPEDGRVRLVYVTPAGREALPLIERAWREAEAVLAEPLSPAQLRELHDLLRRVCGR